MNIIVNIRGYKFGYAKTYYPLIMSWEETMGNSMHCVKKKQTDMKLII